MSDNLERIRRHIKAYQAEQEANLLKMTSSRTIKPPLGTVGKGKGRDDNPLAKYLDVDCFLLCGFASKSTFFGKLPSMLWPVTLVAQLGERYADLGHLETHGSLWRVLKIDNGMNANPAYVLQSSEIGETPLYLTNELELVETVERAARWVIQAVPAPKRELPSYPTDDNMQGIFVQILLQTSDSDAAADDMINGPSPRMLVSAVSCQDGSGQGVAILTADQINASYARSEGLFWRDNWEIVTEESSSSMGPLQGADFLEEGALID